MALETVADAPTTTWTRDRLIALGVFVFCLGTAVSLAWGFAVHSAPWSDYVGYYGAAAGLATGQGYLLRGVPSALYPAGYPLFLAPLFAAFGVSMTVVKVSAALLHGLSAVLGLAVAWRLMRRPWVAITAGVAIAIWPDLVFYTGESASENLFIPLLLGALLVLALWTEDRRLRWAFVAGALLGAAVLTRVTAEGLTVLFPLAMLLLERSRRGLYAAGLLVLGCVVVLSPWVVRNAIVLGSPVISTNGGANMLMGNSRLAEGGYGNAALQPAIKVKVPSDEIVADRTYTKRAITWMMANPGGILRRVPLKARRLFQTEWIVSFQTIAYQRWEAQFNPAVHGGPVALSGLETHVIALATRYQGITQVERRILALLSVAACFVAYRRRDAGAVWMLIVFGYWMFVHVTIGYGAARYLIGVFPVMLLLSIYVLDGLLDLFVSTKPASEPSVLAA